MNYNEFFKEFNQYLSTTYSIRLDTGHVFEHALFKLAESPEFKPELHHDSYVESVVEEHNYQRRKKLLPEHVCIRIALTKEIGSQYVAALKRYFNVETITGIFSNYYGYYYIKIPLQLIAEHKDKIYEKIAELMQEPSAAFAYRCHTNQTDFYRDFKFKLDQILSEFGLDKFKCDIVGMVLLNMFQSKAKLTKSHFDRGAHNFGYLLETYFYLNISKNEAKQLVESITSEFPPIDNNAFGPLARLVSSDAFVTVGNENRGPFRKIIIDTRLLTSELFLHKFKETLKKTLDAEPFLYDELKQACGTQQYKTSHYATRLRLVTSFKDYMSHESNPKKETKLLKAKTSLSKAIDSLADALTKPTEGEAVQTLSERRSRAEKLRRKVCFFESRLSNETYKAFQGTDKKVIKDVVTNLGLQ